MKKVIITTFIFPLLLLLTSWGFTGHRTVALIAERHLTPQAKAAVASLLDGQSIADVSTWADEIRNQPEYKHTAGWHFLNLPLGLSRKEFEKAIKSQSQKNVYSALYENADLLEMPNITKEQKATALKFIIHLVGDVHQPMHVSRAEDKGGNTIQVQFEGKGTNLHSLWDSRLLDKQGLDDNELVEKLDKESVGKQKGIKNSRPMQWAWESYQISSKIYSEIKSGSKLDDEYYQKHIGTVNQRLEEAGLRLAELLNITLGSKAKTKEWIIKDTPDDPKPQASEPPAVKQIELKEAAKHTGEYVQISGVVSSTRDMGSFVLVNIGGEYPNQLLTIVLRGQTKTIANQLSDKVITVSGIVTEYKGKPQIEVRDKEQVTIK